MANIFNQPNAVAYEWKQGTSTCTNTTLTSTTCTVGKNTGDIIYKLIWNNKTYYSNSITIIPTTAGVPIQGYEDEVRTTYTNNPFADTNLLTDEGKAAAELYNRNVIGGFPDGEFKGSRPVNRDETAKFLLLARGITSGNHTNNGRFGDVLDGEWYVPYVIEAANRGIINGHPDGSFRPGDGIQRVELLKMMALTFGLQLNQSYTYRDIATDAWYKPYVGIAQRYNLFTDTGAQYLNGGHKLTRREVAIAIYQYLKNR